VGLQENNTPQEAIKKKGYFKAYYKANGTNLEHPSAIKQAMAQQAELNNSTSGEDRTFKKSKMAQEHAETGQADPALCADLLAEIKQSQSNTDNNKAKGEQAASDMFYLYANICQLMQSTCGTRLSKSRPQVTPIQTSKAVPRKDQRDFCASCLTILWSHHVCQQHG
jgi:hypothetical protein